MRLAPVALALCVAASAAAQEVEAPEDFPEGPGREDTFYACVACHNFKLVAAQGLSRERWDETLDWMVERQAMQPLDDDIRAVVLDYLAVSFPPKPAAAGGGWRNPFVGN